MANHKANEPRIQMRVPISFRDKVMIQAQASGMEAAKYLEKCDVIRDAVSDALDQNEMNKAGETAAKQITPTTATNGGTGNVTG